MILTILLLAFFLRLISLNQSLWLDEAISALAAKDYSFWQLVTTFPLGDTHPPLYYFLLKVWASVLGYSEVPLRLLSVVIGVVSVYAIYKIGKKVGGIRLGLISSLFLATSPLHVYYSQEVRMYALSTLGVLLVFLFFLEKRWVLFSLAVLLLGLTDYLPLLVLPVLFFLAIFTKRSLAWKKKFLASFLPLSIFLIVWLPTFKSQTLSTTAYLSSFSNWAKVLGGANLKELVLVWVKFIVGRISFSPTRLYYGVVAISSFPFIFGLINTLKEKRRYIGPWLWFLVPIVVSFIGSFFVPGFSYFRLIFVLPAFYLLAAGGIVKSKYSKYLTSLVVILNLFFWGNYAFQEKFFREDWKGAVKFLEEKISDDEVVIMVFPESFAPYRWYGKKLDKAFGVKKNFAEDESVAQEIKRVTEGKRGVYTLDYLLDLSDSGRKAFEILRLVGFKEQEVYNFRGIGQIRYWRL